MKSFTLNQIAKTLGVSPSVVIAVAIRERIMPSYLVGSARLWSRAGLRRIEQEINNKQQHHMNATGGRTETPTPRQLGHEK